MKVRFLDIVRLELESTIDFYETESEGLGGAFYREFLSSVERIVEFPSAWQPFPYGTRRCLLRRFPYGVIYALVDDEVLVFALAHLHRLPDYWIDRVRKRGGEP